MNKYEKRKTIFCNRCGKENEAGAAFCMNCGTALEASAVQADDSVKVASSPKKKNIAALTMGLLSVVLAIALVFSLTGIFRPSGATTSVFKRFSTPENTINYFVTRLERGDFDGCLKACAINEIAKGFKFKDNTERLNIVMPLSTSTYLPAEYPLYVRYNANQALRRIMLQMIHFAISFNISEENEDILYYYTMKLQDGKMPDTLIKEMDPSNLKGLELISIDKTHRHDSESVLKNRERLAKIYGADDVQYRTVLYKYDGNYYVGGFTLMKYGGKWLIESMSNPFSSISSSGVPEPLSDRTEYEYYFD